jgi:hypothetical protein
MREGERDVAVREREMRGCGRERKIGEDLPRRHLRRRRPPPSASRGRMNARERRDMRERCEAALRGWWLLSGDKVGPARLFFLSRYSRLEASLYHTTNQLNLITFILVWKLTMLVDMCNQKMVSLYLL